MVEGVPRGGQTAAGRRYGSSGDLARGQGAAVRGDCAEGGCRRPDPRKPSAEKKHDRGWGVRGMRYSASEKLEIIRTVETSHLPARQTLDMLGTPSTTYYRWYDRWCEGGLDALE